MFSGWLVARGVHTAQFQLTGGLVSNNDGQLSTLLWTRVESGLRQCTTVCSVV
jgi:hypothetical protein